MMLRLSSYFILSDRLKDGGYAVLSGLSGAIELINDDLYRLFDELIRTGDPHELYIEESMLPPDILATFLKRGHITYISHEEERAYLENVAAILHESAIEHPGVVIVPNMDCNYRCVYCFEKPLQTKLQSGKTMMDKDNVDAVYRSISQLESKVGKISETITLFGGEPLMSANRDIVQYIVEKGLERGLRFSAITNGHDLSLFMPLLGKNGIKRLQITIDGIKSVHDKRRISLDKCSSYERIVGNMRKAVAETDVQITIRINLDRDNFQSFGALIDDFKKEGWLNNKRIFINAAIVELRDNEGAVFSSQDINIIRAELSSLIKDYSNIAIGSEQSANGDIVFYSLLSGKPYSLRSCYCAASSGMYIFLPNGNISACWESLDDECGLIGCYSQNGLQLDDSKSQRFFGRSAAKIPACADCKYCLVCAGGCPLHAKYNSGDIYSPHCGDFPQTYAWVLADAVQKFLKTTVYET